MVDTLSSNSSLMLISALILQKSTNSRVNDLIARSNMKNYEMYYI